MNLEVNMHAECPRRMNITYINNVIVNGEYGSNPITAP